MSSYDTIIVGGNLRNVCYLRICTFVQSKDQIKWMGQGGGVFVIK